jgi:hypothetical protein
MRTETYAEYLKLRGQLNAQMETAMAKREEFFELRARHKALWAATQELAARLEKFRDEPGFWTIQGWDSGVRAVPVEELSEKQLMGALRDAASAAGQVGRDAPSLARDQLDALLEEAQRRRAPKPEEPAKTLYKHPSVPINLCAESPQAPGVSASKSPDGRGGMVDAPGNPYMSPLDAIAEWRRGCSCAVKGSPEQCQECTRALVDALKHKLRAGHGVKVAVDFPGLDGELVQVTHPAPGITNYSISPANGD